MGFVKLSFHPTLRTQRTQKIGPTQQLNAADATAGQDERIEAIVASAVFVVFVALRTLCALHSMETKHA